MFDVNKSVNQSVTDLDFKRRQSLSNCVIQSMKPVSVWPGQSTTLCVHSVCVSVNRPSLHHSVIWSVVVCLGHAVSQFLCGWGSQSASRRVTGSVSQLLCDWVSQPVAVELGQSASRCVTGSVSQQVGQSASGCETVSVSQPVAVRLGQRVSGCETGSVRQ